MYGHKDLNLGSVSVEVRVASARWPMVIHHWIPDPDG